MRKKCHLILLITVNLEDLTWCVSTVDIHFADKGPYSQSYGFSSSHVGMWELDHKEGWAPKKWCFWTVVLEKTLESPLDCKEIKLVIPKGNQPWIFIGRINAEVEAPILWPSDAKSQLIGKDPDAGKDWGQEKGQQRMRWVGWHHQLTGHEFEQTPGDSGGQGSLRAAVHGVIKSRTRLSVTEQTTAVDIQDTNPGAGMAHPVTGSMRRLQPPSEGACPSRLFRGSAPPAGWLLEGGERGRG